MPTKPLPTRAVLSLAALSLASLALASCAKDATTDRPNDTTGGSGGSEGGVADASIDRGNLLPINPPDVDTPRGDGNMHPNLPPPWRFSSAGGVYAYKDTASPYNALGLFNGTADANPDDKPLIVYPLEASVHPMNLGVITFQWQQGNANNTLFRIETKVGTDTFDFFVTSKTGQCQLQMPESEWLDLGERFAGQTLTFTIAGTDGLGGVVATSDPLTISFSPSPVIGGLYYWASSKGTIMRATFGSSKAVPYLAPLDKTVGLGSTGCVACHSVSRDGKTTAYAVTSPTRATDASGSTDAPWGIFVTPTEDLTKPYQNPVQADGMVVKSYGSFPALSADGTLLAVNGNNPATGGTPVYFEVRNARDGTSLDKQLMQNHPVFGAAYDMALYPEWSPDGKYIAVTLTPIDWACFWDHKSCGGTIGLIPWDNTAKKMGAALPLIQSAAGSEKTSYFYPTWSPDGKWIAFASGRPPFPGDASDNTPQSSYDAKDAVLRIIPSDPAGAPYLCPGPKCIELTNATRYAWAKAMAGNGQGSTWPKFTPFAQGVNKDLFFITYTSRINYGFSQSPDLHQLWMSAIDMSVVTSGAVDEAGAPADPSRAPFWVPYQATAEKNVEPYWTEVLSCSIDPKGGCQGCVGGEDCKLDEFGGCFCAANVK